MLTTSILVLAFCVDFITCFPQDALIGVRFDHPESRESEKEPLIGLHHSDEESDTSHELIAIAPKLQEKAVSPLHRELPIKGRSAGFCVDKRQFYESHCMSMFTDRDEETRKALFKFCPWFENKCLHKR